MPDERIDWRRGIHQMVYGSGGKMDELREVLVQLKQRGVCGHISNGSPAQIIGGRSVSMTRIGTVEVPVYQESFSIVRRKDSWTVCKDSGGQLVEEVTVPTAEDVLNLVLNAAGPSR
jgi:hypothetical protein